MRTAPMACGLVIVVATLVGGCASGVSQEEYDAAVSALEEAEAREQGAVAQLDLELERAEELQGRLETAEAALAQCREEGQRPGCGESALAAWDATWKRHERIRQDVPERGLLLDLAGGMVFPAPPEWLEGSTVCSIEIEPGTQMHESYCLVEAPGGEMLVNVSTDDDVVSMLCKGGATHYGLTVSTGDDGRIVQQMFVVGDDYAQLEWVGPETMERFVAIYNGIEYTNYWPVNEGEHEAVYDSFVDWLAEVDIEGGLVAEADRPFIVVGLGELRGLPYAGLTLSEPEALKRAFADLMFGIPMGSVPLRSVNS